MHANDDFARAMLTLDRLLANLFRADTAAARRAENERRAAELAKLRHRLESARSMRDAVREDLAECDISERGALVREFNACTATITAVTRQIEALAK